MQQRCNVDRGRRVGTLPRYLASISRSTRANIVTLDVTISMVANTEYKGTRRDPLFTYTALRCAHTRCRVRTYESRHNADVYTDADRGSMSGDKSRGDIAPGLPAVDRSRDRWIIDRYSSQRVGAACCYATYSCNTLRTRVVEHLYSLATRAHP